VLADDLFHQQTIGVQLADLLVEPGNEDIIRFLAFVLVPVEYTNDHFQQELLPCLNLTGVYLVPGGQLGRRILTFDSFQLWALALALNDGLCFLCSLDMSHSSFTSTAAARLRAEPSLSRLSEKPDPLRDQVDPGRLPPREGVGGSDGGLVSK